MKISDEGGKLPLHSAFDDGAAEEEIMALLEAHPGAAGKKSSGGEPPLHRALWRGMNAVSMALLEAHPGAASEKSMGGNLPLHTAILSYNGISEEVIMALLEAHPGATEEKNIRGELPLHSAFQRWAWKNISMAVLGALLTANPRAAKETTKYGLLPYHLATTSRKKASEELVAALLREHPDAAHIDKPRETFQQLFKRRASDELILAIVDAASAQEKGKSGGLPIHWASMYGTEAVVRALLDAYPQGAKQKDEDGDLPLHWALKYGAPKEVVAALLESDMPLRLDGGVPVEHARSWTICVSSDKEAAAAAVRSVLAPEKDGGRGFHVRIRELAQVPNERGRSAIIVAASGPRQAINEYLEG